MHKTQIRSGFIDPIWTKKKKLSFTQNLHRCSRKTGQFGLQCVSFPRTIRRIRTLMTVTFIDKNKNVKFYYEIDNLFFIGYDYCCSVNYLAQQFCYEFTVKKIKHFTV